jgi:dUTP pyrophosphatase
MTEPIKLCLTEQGAKVLHAQGITPETYGTAYAGESAGLDLYNCGEEVTIPGRTKWSVFEEPAIMISTGIKISVPPGYVGLVKERGSILNTGLTIRGGVIDSGYTGEVFVNLVNVGNRDTIIPLGLKLPLQLVVVSCLREFEVISNLKFLDETSGSRRQAGQVGSSDVQPTATQTNEAP